jgi:hypothetical protein
MKKSLLSLALVAMGFGFANAETITFDVNAKGNISYEGTVDGNNVNPITSMSLQDFNVTFDSSNANNGCAWYYILSDDNSNADWRVYANGAMTIAAPTGCTMTEISIQFASSWGSANYSNVSASTGAFSPIYTEENKPANGDVITWTGSANELTITVPSSKDSWMSKNPQLRFTSMTITYTTGDGPVAPAAPKISGTTPFYTPTSAVTITASAGATIYYTLSYEGEPADPTTDSAEYEEEIVINNSATIKAIAVRDGLVSEVATASFVKAEAEEVADIAAFLAKDNDAVCKFVNPLTIVYVGGKYLFVKDESGSLQIYNSAAAFPETLLQGQTVTGFTAVRGVYGNNPQASIANYSDTFPTEGTGDAATVLPTEVTLADACGEAYYNTYVAVKNYNLVKIGNYYYLVDGEADENGAYPTQVQLYNRFGLETAITDEMCDKAYDVEGFAVIYNSTHEIFYTKIDETSGVKAVMDNAVVYGGNGEIVAPAGAKVYGVNGVSYTTSGLNAGLYIVVADGKAYKVVVK